MLASILKGNQRAAKRDVQRRINETASDDRDDTQGDRYRYTRAALSRLHLLRQAELDNVEPLLLRCGTRVLAPGETLLHAGSSCAALYLVLEGALRAHDPSANVPDTMIKTGDSVGELFLLQDAVMARTIVAAERTHLLAVDAVTGWALIAASHAVARNLLQLLAERARVGSQVTGGELKASYQRVATLDETTGLHNRRWLESILPRQIMRSATDGKPLALLLVEIDDFAGYNAQFGRTAGDYARYAVAQTLINNVRPTDLIACYGAAQFAIVLPESDLAGARIVGQRLLHAVSEAVVLMSDESILPSPTVSIGAVQFQPATEAANLLAAGEAAVRSAINDGGNRLAG